MKNIEKFKAHLKKARKRVRSQMTMKVKYRKQRDEALRTLWFWKAMTAAALTWQIITTILFKLS